MTHSVINNTALINANYELALNTFLAAPEFEQAVITATHADHHGNTYYVQLLSDGSYIVGYRQHLFNGGKILVVPPLVEDEYEWDESTNSILNPFTWNVEQELREAFAESIA